MLLHRHPEIDRAAVAAAGNIYRYEYDQVDEALIWHSVRHSLTSLRSVPKMNFSSRKETYVIAVRMDCCPEVGFGRRLAPPQRSKASPCPRHGIGRQQTREIPFAHTTAQCGKGTVSPLSVNRAVAMRAGSDSTASTNLPWFTSTPRNLTMPADSPLETPSSISATQSESNW